MDLKKIIVEQKLSNVPIGLGGCRISEFHFDSCAYDLFVFDGSSDSDRVIQYENEFLIIHHASLSETQSKNLLRYNNLQILQDESWDLRMFLSKINEKHSHLYSDFSKNCLIESKFCCQKTRDAIANSDKFASCWQKCASYYLADAISSLNHQYSSPSHMLDLLRNLNKSSINDHISVVTQTVGIERTTPTLLSRMSKSTVGFSDMVENNHHSKIIQQKHDFYVKNSMLSDCYFYLGYVNKENFMKVKDILNREQDLIHILKVAFDVESDSNLLLHQVDLVQKSCDVLLELSSKK